MTLTVYSCKKITIPAVLAACLLTLVFASACAAGTGLGRKQQRELQTGSQLPLSMGQYDKAIAAAEDLMTKHGDDPVLLVWGLRIEVSALSCKGRLDDAAKLVESVIHQHAHDDQIYTGSFHYPMRLFLDANGHGLLAEVYRENDDYPAAIAAKTREQEAWRKCISWAGEQNQIDRQYTPNVFCEMSLGAFYRLKGDCSQAAVHYRAAVAYMKQNPWPKDVVLGAVPNDVALLMEADTRIAQCADTSPSRIEFLQNVDYAIEVAKTHEEAGERYSNKAHWQKARKLYQSALQYLATHETPSGIRGTLDYEDYRAKVLPANLKRCDKAISQLKD